MLLQSNVISNALVLHLCPTEKTVDDDMEKSLVVCNENIDTFEAVHLFSCCYAYREGMEKLLAKGVAKAFWSLDAGTEETFEKTKRKKIAFMRVLDNVEKYQKYDAFGGASIIPKYAIVKGLNDNTSEEDYEIIRTLYRKICAAGLKITFSSGSTVLSRALNRLVIYEDGPK